MRSYTTIITIIIVALMVIQQASCGKMFSTLFGSSKGKGQTDKQVTTEENEGSFEKNENAPYLEPASMGFAYNNMNDVKPEYIEHLQKYNNNSSGGHKDNNRSRRKKKKIKTKAVQESSPRLYVPNDEIHSFNNIEDADPNILRQCGLFK